MLIKRYALRPIVQLSLWISPLNSIQPICNVHLKMLTVKYLYFMHGKKKY